jgi:5-formyltetrahydrofolate cyclo-ligase
VNTKQSLRQELLAARRSVGVAARVKAARAVARVIAHTPWLAPGKRIGVYSSMPQELGTEPLIALALARRCEVYVPRIVSMRAHRIEFVPYNLKGRVHAFGMHEPASVDFLGARWMHTIFVPGVAFDRRGARLGHGAGFYDRALAFKRLRSHWRGPRLVGLAYSFQVVPQVPVTATDVFMDLLVTDRGIDEPLADENGTLDVRSR